MVREIQLTQGKVALVNDEDYEAVNALTWFAHRKRPRSDGTCQFYAIHSVYVRVDGKKVNNSVPMHRFLMGSGARYDHKDGNGLNNQRYNLRFATATQNSANARKRAGGTSRFKGVSWFAPGNLWVAKLQVNKERQNIGYFKIEEDAARAYDAAARIHFGEFANLNFPLEGVNR